MRAVVRELTGGAGCERVLEVTGEAGPLELATDLIGVRGRLVIAGYHQDGPRQVNLQRWNWQGLDVINAHERAPEVYRAGLRAAVAAATAGTLQPAPLCTHRFPLDGLSEAFALLRARPDGFLKAVVCM